MQSLSRPLRRLAGLAGALVSLGALLAGWLLIELSARAATAIVTEKRAVITGLTSGSTPGSYRHHFYLDVRFPLEPEVAGAWRWGLEAEAQEALQVSEGQYDSAQVGDSVGVRYVPWLGGRAWLDGQTMWASLAVPLSWALVLRALFWALVLVVGWRLLKTLGGQGPAMSVRWACTVLTLMGIVSVLPELPELVTLGHGPPVPAVVRSVNRYDIDTGSRYHLKQPLLLPYVRVALEFTPAGASEAVVAVDEITDGSLPALRPGATMMLTHAPGAPREARLVGASRLFRVANHILNLGIMAVVLLVGALASRWRSLPSTQSRSASAPQGTTRQLERGTLTPGTRGTHND